MTVLYGRSARHRGRSGVAEVRGCSESGTAGAQDTAKEVRPGHAPRRHSTATCANLVHRPGRRPESHAIENWLDPVYRRAGRRAYGGPAHGSLAGRVCHSRTGTCPRRLGKAGLGAQAAGGPPGTGRWRGGQEGPAAWKSARPGRHGERGSERTPEGIWKRRGGISIRYGGAGARGGDRQQIVHCQMQKNTGYRRR